MISYSTLVVIIIVCFALKAAFGGFRKDFPKPVEKDWNNKMTDEEYDYWNDENNWR